MFKHSSNDTSGKIQGSLKTIDHETKHIGNMDEETFIFSFSNVRKELVDLFSVLLSEQVNDEYE